MLDARELCALPPPRPVIQGPSLAPGG